MKPSTKVPVLAAVSLLGLVGIVALAVWWSGGLGNIFHGGKSQSATVLDALSTAANFGVLAHTTVTNTGNSVITGDLGLSPGTSVTGFPPGTVSGTQHVTDGVAAQAQIDLVTAYNSAAGSGPTSPISTIGAGQTLTPGVYNSASSIQLNGALTLDGGGNPDAVFVFQAGSTLTTASASSIVLTHGTQACNVFWQVGSSATLGTGSDFKGSILAMDSISDNGGSTVYGRLLARTAAVTLINTAVTVPTCTTRASGTVSGTNNGDGGSSGDIVPVIGILKVPSPLVLPTGPGSVTYNYTVFNVIKLQTLVGVTVTDNKCSPVTFLSGDLNGNGKLDPDENWKYSCTTTLATTTTNTATATGYSDNALHQTTIATAVATVVVGATSTPPLIAIVKVPSRLTPFPFGGGDVTYTYTVTNPGVVAMHDVTVTDNKCSPVSRISGDTNANNLLEPSETWTYTCLMNVPISTKNTATVRGFANGFAAIGYAFANVLVSIPDLPNTGFPPKI